MKNKKIIDSQKGDISPPSSPLSKRDANISNISSLLDKGILTDSYRYSIISYCPPNEVDNLVFQACKFYAYIYHDNDVKADGTPKEPHYHYFLEFSQGSPRKILNLMESFRIAEYTFLCENVRSKKVLVRYLCHLDDPDKYQYDYRSIFSSDTETVEKYCVSDVEKNALFIEDLFNLSMIDMARKYGRDYIKNVEKYEDFKRRFGL